MPLPTETPKLRRRRRPVDVDGDVEFGARLAASLYTFELQMRWFTRRIDDVDEAQALRV